MEPTLPETWWSAAGRPLLESALAVVLASLVAELVLVAVPGTGGSEPGSLAAGPRLTGPAFLVRVASTAIGLLVMSCVLLLARPGRIRLRIGRRGLVLCGLGLLGLLSINALASWGIKEIQEDYRGFPEIPPGVMGMLVIAVGAAFAPVAEELFFREALLCRVLVATPRPLAILVTSLGFGALHLAAGGALLFLALSAMGVVLAVVRLRTDSLGAAILIHAANNLAALLLASASGGLG